MQPGEVLPVEHVLPDSGQGHADLAFISCDMHEIELVGIELLGIGLYGAHVASLLAPQVLPQ